MTLEGRPQGKGRPRYTVRTGRAFAYTPASTRAYEASIRQAWIEQDGRSFGSCPVALILRAYYPVPSKARKAEQEAMLTGKIPVSGKPDLDNVLKIVMDGLNGLAYEDDSQITCISATRAYGTRPRLEVEILPLIKGDYES